MSGAYSALNSESFASAWSMSFHSCLGDSGVVVFCEGVSRLSSVCRLLSLKEVASRKFFTWVTGVSLETLLERNNKWNVF